MMEHSYSVLIAPEIHFNNIAKIELENIEEPIYWLSVHNVPDVYKTNPMSVVRIASEIRKFYRESGVEPNLEVMATIEYIIGNKDISKIKLTKLC